ncbi:hypothetical protein GUJ93_ZPchr0009g703 [Zizania palustris]|uniref:B box-type domain-containing protein n=1 Tax=Zizania palustris TaxID=103762 RepID=A0A8J5VKY8_ZIZPA|nr:hypothetical protein GUJ93_ZPchr0009g703 [Zizania palustris]
MKALEEGQRRGVGAWGRRQRRSKGSGPPVEGMGAQGTDGGAQMGSWSPVEALGWGRGHRQRRSEMVSEGTLGLGATDRGARRERTGYFFCLQDRALLCWSCDVAVHTATPHVAAHRRFLITGVRIGGSVDADSAAVVSPSSSSIAPAGSASGNRAARGEARIIYHWGQAKTYGTIRYDEIIGVG